MEQLKHNLETEIKSQIQTLSDDVLEGNSSILSTTGEMTKLTKKTLQNISTDFSKELKVEEKSLPFGLFLFGSPSRNMMLPNSDLDVGVVYEKDCPESVQTKLISFLSALPFDKIDIPKWHSIESMTKNSSVDMMEYSKAVDAQFVSDNQNIKQEYANRVRKQDTKEDKIGRFITDYGLLRHYNYVSKISDWGFNLKYDFGASRDLIFFDWYFLIYSDYDKAGDASFTRKGQDLLLKRNIIDVQTYKSLLQATELVLLVKFVLLHKFREKGDSAILSLSNYSLQTAFEYAPQAFKRLNIKDADGLISSYFEAKGIIHNVVETMYTEIAHLQPDLAQKWKEAKTAESLNLEGSQMDLNTWQQLVPYAINSNKAELLDQIVEEIKDINGFEYILRIVSENKHLNKDIAAKLLQSRLPDKSKIKLKNKYALEDNDT